MMKSVLLGAAVAIGLATGGYAAMAPAPIGRVGSAIVGIAEGCGPGFWRGPGGRCHPMAMGRACPRGYHLGPERRRCWPD
jgi:hypothetical protein